MSTMLEQTTLPADRTIPVLDLGDEFTFQMENQIGTKVTVKTRSMESVYRILRTFGSKGWTTGDIPVGGIQLPYKMAALFDWSLIGAREFEYNAVENGQPVKKKAVYYRGDTYRRRDNPAKKEKGVDYPDMINYSRGGRPSDPENIKESRTEAIKDGFVTLITFRGNGPIVTALCKPPQ